MRGWRREGERKFRLELEEGRENAGEVGDGIWKRGGEIQWRISGNSLNSEIGREFVEFGKSGGEETKRGRRAVRLGNWEMVAQWVECAGRRVSRELG